ncbi:MAG TPA: lysylphosphatidylglycerol synthase domain-containing protein [Gaiellaceae bacterium]|nr:lysylphosphatidylglycerol synthase domain-containing protein [Gaiellaceae bacterium]
MRALLSNRKVQVGLNAGLGLALLGVSYVTLRHYMGIGWPLHNADPILVGGAVGLFLIAYAFKAWGWQRLFHEHERPAAGALAFAGGAACVGGVAMPGRVDDAIRIACVKRYPGTRAGLGAIGLTLIIVGMLDNAALAPLASVAMADASSWTVRAGYGVVAVAGVLAALVVAFLPQVSRRRRVMRFRVGRWLSEHTQCRKESFAALLLISVSWALRGTAVFLLLNALALKGSFPLALGFLCASAASAAVPVGPAGAAMQAGAGATLLVLSGVPKADAIAFSVAAQALIVVTGAAVILLIAAWNVAIRIRPRQAAF